MHASHCGGETDSGDGGGDGILHWQAEPPTLSALLAIIGVVHTDGKGLRIRSWCKQRQVRTIRRRCRSISVSGTVQQNLGERKVERKTTCSIPSLSAPTTRKCHPRERRTRSLCATWLHNNDNSPHAREQFDRGVEKQPLTPTIASQNEPEHREIVTADRHRDWQNSPLLI